MGIAAGVDTTTDGRDARGVSHIFLRPIGRPLPLGMAALAGASVLLTGMLTLLSPPGRRNQVLGLLLLFASATLLGPALAASLGKVAVSPAFVLAAARFALTGIYDYQGGTAWGHASGWTGLALCLAALYNASAFEIEDTGHRTVLPGAEVGKRPPDHPRQRARPGEGRRARSRRPGTAVRSPGSCLLAG